MFTEFNQESIEYFREEIQSKLDELAELGIVVTLGNIRYGNTNFNGKIEVAFQNGPDKYENEFNRSIYKKQYPDAIGKTVTLSSGTYTFCGFRPRARKQKALIKNSAGKTFRVDFSVISSQL
jgi:hypothetical protein